ncbi:phage tail protein [Heliobacillus mobilis]|uniref:Phage tail protein n=1 Tax=Heliobacterium mobile TaxID=28064 RepID=A0A6I3SBS4_HELMO|nr:phage tail protein [Heliobacterium mobile]MTV47772.1 phage tail protein [Heliobacterium mobile]
MANSVTTNAARAKFAQAHGGSAALPAITQIGWGNGGHNPATSEPIAPDPAATQVPGEFLVKNIDGHSFPVATTLRITGSLGLTEGNGQNVSAVGLYDSAGTLVALKTFRPKAKDDETVMEIDWDEEF